MNPFAGIGFGLLSLGMLGNSWLGWQLLRQNGRILLRLDELEKRLDALEFGEEEQTNGLSVGTEAPAFELRDLAGNSRTLAEFRGRPLLLIFFNPACGFCRELLPKLAALSPSPLPEERDGKVSGSHVLIISTGDAEANRTLFEEHRVTYPVVMQKEMEVAAAYRANGTPSGYLISAEGRIAGELAIGAEALLEIARENRSSRREEAQTSYVQSSSGNGHSEEQSLVTSAATNRFKERSLARSKIKRDGLKAGTAAPDFRLPRLDGRGELSLSDFRGQRVLLVFSSPHCGPCSALAPELEKFHRANRALRQPVNPLSSDQAGPANGGEGRGEEAASIEVIMISKGEPKENRAKVKEHGLTFPVVLQQQWEISRRYAMFATPIAYLIDEKGVIVEDVAVGSEAIQKLISTCAAFRVTGDIEMTRSGF